MSVTYSYPRPAVTVDAVVFAPGRDDLRVLLIERAKEPYAGCWALPGGFVDEDEPLDQAAMRELREETGVDLLNLKQLGAFGDAGRDPRSHTVSVAYWGVTQRQHHDVTAQDDARAARWWSYAALPPLAFDHALIIKRAHTAFMNMKTNYCGYSI